jgi:hypothetical protein
VSSSDARKQRVYQEKLLRKIDKEIPVLEFDFGGPLELTFGGPIINTDITITDQHQAALAVAGLAVPEAVRCRFLLDTGADGCVVKHEIAERAGLKLINPSTPLHGVGIDTTGRTYFGRILFHCPSRIDPGVSHTFSVDVEIQSAKLEADHLNGLIGRTVLQHFETIYDGMKGKVIMKITGKSAATRKPPTFIQ